MQSKRVFTSWDVIPTLVQLAVNGYGSLGSDPRSCAPSERTLANAGNSAVGCYFFNPFTNAVAVSGINGAANPYYRGTANPAVLNNEDVVDGMFRRFTNTSTNQLFVADLVLTGSIGIELPGGRPEWAAGAQYRTERYVEDFSGVTNIDAFPYTDSVDDGTPAGPFRTGVTAGSTPNSNFDVTRKINAIFAELKLPILDSLEVNAAIRRENYVGIGGTVNYKFSARWQPLDWLTLRASTGTNFRPPRVVDASPSCQNFTSNLLGAVRPYALCGDPNIQPETATTYNAGAIVQFEGFRASVDYYKLAFKGQLTSEAPGALANAMFPGGSTARCGDPAFAALQARFTFAGGVCSPANYLGLKTFIVNGPSTDTDGIDFQASYTWNDMLIQGSRWNVGINGTYLLSYDLGNFGLNGAPNVIFNPARPRAGTYDFTTYNVFSRLRMNTYVGFSQGPLRLNWSMTYHEGTVADVGNATFIQVPDSSQAAGARLDPIGKLRPEIRHDFTVSYEMPWGTTLALSVLNVFDKDPPFAPTNFGYDVTKADPLGRVFKINLRHAF